MFGGVMSDQETEMLKTLGYAALIGGTLIAAPAFAQNSNDTFVKQQAMNQWRASKLVGVKIVGNDQKKIGSIEDVLIDHDGNAQTVVIGVGGFLGIGEKNVAVPFKTLQWQTEGRAVAVNPPDASPGGVGQTSAPATVKTDPAATEASQGYPDMAMLDMTKQQLQNAPNFHYAATPVVDNPASPAPAAMAPKGDAGALAPAPTDGAPKQ
jgi:sporulation protein YlmC with PRC-barrel domain